MKNTANPHKLLGKRPRRPQGEMPKRLQKRTSTLNAEEYRVKYLVNGNASLSRLLRYARMQRRETQ